MSPLIERITNAVQGRCRLNQGEVLHIPDGKQTIHEKIFSGAWARLA
jgi:hypothetical protein